jgi:trimeric autotransporter adhesin
VLEHGDDAAPAGGRLRVAAPTLVRVTTSGPAALEGEPLHLTAQLRTTREAGPPPTGAVLFRVGHRVLGTAEVDVAGTAVLEGVVLAAGVHGVVACYSGDSHHAAATSAPLPQAVTAPLLPVLLAVAAPVRRPDGVVLEAELLDPVTGRLLEGTSGQLSFTVDGLEAAVVGVVSGQARVVVPDLAPGRLSAAFAGEGEYAPASGAALDVAAGT